MSRSLSIIGYDRGKQPRVGNPHGRTETETPLAHASPLQHPRFALAAVVVALVVGWWLEHRRSGKYEFVQPDLLKDKETGVTWVRKGDNWLHFF